MNKNIDHVKISRSSTIKQLIQTIQDSGPLACALVYDGVIFMNVVTDGDIRRAFLEGSQFEDTVDSVLAVKNRSSRPAPVVASVHASREKIEALFHDHALRQLILVDDKGEPVSIIDHLSIGCDHAYINQPFVAVVMAGGFGTRLRPLTLDTPKPMLPINGRPLLDILIRKLVDFGVAEVYIATHYLPEKIISYFGDGEKYGVSIKYIHEELPLGTAGALGMIVKPNINTLVINGDILTELNIAMFHAEHMRSDSDMTIAGTQYNIQIPFGVLSEKNGRITAIEEKPVQCFLVNSGIYFASPAAFDLLPRPVSHFTMPQLAEQLIRHERKVSCFAMYEQWLDIGRPEDYNIAREMYQ